MTLDKIGTDVEIRYSYDYPDSYGSTRELREKPIKQ